MLTGLHTVLEGKKENVFLKNTAKPCDFVGKHKAEIFQRRLFSLGPFRSLSLKHLVGKFRRP